MSIEKSHGRQLCVTDLTRNDAIIALNVYVASAEHVSLGLPCVPIRSVVGCVGGWVFFVVLLWRTSFASPQFGYLDCLKNKNLICNFQMSTFLDLEVTVVTKVSDFSCTMFR